ncbi:MAG TPA: chemotaxis response regulator protein-glutamate methylesterase [Candidatus Eisenbacteria bacterium]|jgi:two-component system chemotaxis response regulator CheB
MREHVLVVDDSAVVRQAFSMLLSRQFSIDTAADPLIAERRIRKQRPSVIVLDLQMPRMDGFTFLRRIMRSDPMPVVICSTAAAQGSETAMRALEEGAVDVILKPSVGVREFLEESALLLADTLRAASQARVGRRTSMAVTKRLSADVVLPAAAPRAVSSTQPIVALGASTGGTEALRAILESLPPNAPATLVVQHMPEGFTAAFAKRLDSVARVEVKEAAHGDVVAPGRVLIAPGNKHMLLRRSGSRHTVEIVDGPLVSRHRPSVDVLFRSVAQSAGSSGLGVILTGMGDDGAAGLAEMRAAGAHTIAQDETSSVIFGMPKEAIALGAAVDVLPLQHIPLAILRQMQRP